MILKNIEVNEHKHGVSSTCYIRLEGEHEELQELAFQVHTLINNLNKKNNGN